MRKFMIFFQFFHADNSKYFREDYFNFGGTVKAYFCNKPRQKLSIPKNDFVHEEIKRINQQRSKNAEKNQSPKPVLKANKVLSDSNKLRKREADDKYFLPKDEVDSKAKKGDKLSSIHVPLKML